MRYRLRFLLQEFELTGPEILIGRSPACQITIEDPLVSRQHAAIRTSPERALIVDLGSRNGVRVNGKAIRGEAVLKDGDRIRIGTQELVFSALKRQQYLPRPTGFMRMCEACGTPYPEGAASCPHCGAPTSQDEDTISGFVVEPRRTWTLQLLGEVIERAISTGRATEAEKLMRRAAEEVNQRIRTGERLDATHLAMITAFAMRLARLRRAPDWIEWAFDLHVVHHAMPADAVIDRLEEACADVDSEQVARILRKFVTSCQEAGAEMPASDLGGLARLERLYDSQLARPA